MISWEIRMNHDVNLDSSLHKVCNISFMAFIARKPLKKVLVMYSSIRTSSYHTLMRLLSINWCGSKCYFFFVIFALNLEFKRKNSIVYIPQSFVFSVKIQLSGILVFIKSQFWNTKWTLDSVVQCNWKHLPSLCTY